MSYVVYADVMLAWIFIINYFTYYITCKITNNHLPQLKLILYSIISSVMLELVYISFIYINNGIIKILYMCLNFFMYIIFFIIISKNKFHILKSLCYAIISTITLAGIINIFINKLPHINKLIPILITIYLIIPIIIKICDINKTKNIYQIEVHTRQQVIYTYGYLDTGNTLIDIYSNKPVIILDYRLLSKIISEKDKYNWEKYINTGNYQYIANILIDQELLHPICYKTISNEFSIMPAFKIKRLVVNKKYIYKNIIAAISQTKLSNSNEYMVLLNNNL